MISLSRTFVYCPFLTPISVSLSPLLAVFLPSSAPDLSLSGKQDETKDFTDGWPAQSV
jgi:hypothetical protein